MNRENVPEPCVANLSAGVGLGSGREMHEGGGRRCDQSDGRCAERSDVAISKEGNARHAATGVTATCWAPDTTPGGGERGEDRRRRKSRIVEAGGTEGGKLGRRDMG